MAHKIMSIVGTRPNFVKLAALSEKMPKTVKHIIVHTGQHFDNNMFQNLFLDLKIPKPDYNLGINSVSDCKQTGAMIIQLEFILKKEKPDIVLLYGDVNSTLAGAIVSSKLGIKSAHIEAGIRMKDEHLQEEINRRVTDRISDILFAPTETAYQNIISEGIPRNRVFLVGNVMQDILLERLGHIKNIKSYERFGLKNKNYVLLTLHRAENVDNLGTLSKIVYAISKINEPILFLVHPRTQKRLEQFKLTSQIKPNVLMLEPQNYSDFISLLYNSKAFITDSGGAQAEAAMLGIPTFTLLDYAPWPEIVEQGSNTLVDPKNPVFPKDLTQKKKKFLFIKNASSKIVDKILSELGD